MDEQDKVPEQSESWPPPGYVPDWGMGPKEELDPPEELPEELVAAIREDLKEHDIELEIDRDVSWQGHAPEGALIEAWLASASGAGGFYCVKCQRRFIVGEPVHGPLRTARLLRKNPALAEQLRGVAPDQLDSMVAAWERGDLAPEINKKRLRKAAGRSRGRRRRDASVHRREACQAVMLKRMAEVGHLPTVCKELHNALLANPSSCIKLTGMKFPPSEETLRKYWSGGDHSVPEAERLAAKAAFEARPEAERAQIQKEIRLEELRPPDYLTP